MQYIVNQALSLFTVGNSSGIPVEVEVNHESLVMELDTGAAVSIISEEVVKEKFPGASIQPSSGEMLEIVGELPVQVVYLDQGCV